MAVFHFPVPTFIPAFIHSLLAAAIPCLHLSRQALSLNHIAGHARSLGLIIVTTNLREFERVPEVSVENLAG